MRAWAGAGDDADAEAQAGGQKAGGVTTDLDNFEMLAYRLDKHAIIETLVLAARNPAAATKSGVNKLAQ